MIQQISFEGGIQYDKIKRTTGYVGISLRFGLGKANNNKIEGIMRHMSDLMRRDPDIVVEEREKQFIPGSPNPAIFYLEGFEEDWEDGDWIGAGGGSRSVLIKKFGPESLAKQCEEAYEFLRDGEIEQFKRLVGKAPDSFKECEFINESRRKSNLLGLSVQFWKVSRSCKAATKLCKE